MMESADAFGDSDDEVDYTKMDQGNKKGPVGRWDFDTQEEYSTYMANKEALPKYVFLCLILTLAVAPLSSSSEDIGTTEVTIITSAVCIILFFCLHFSNAFIDIQLFSINFH